MTVDPLWASWRSQVGRAEAPMFVEGCGVMVTDDRGRRFIDAVSGSLNTVLGHGHPGVVGAVVNQLQKFAHHDAAISDHPMRTQLAQRLSDANGGDRGVLFVNSGSEANEAALYVALQYSEIVGTRRREVLSLRQGYHGTTLSTRALSGLPFAGSPVPSGFKVRSLDLPTDGREVRTDETREHVLTQAAAFLESGNVAAVFIEPLLNVAGGVVLPRGLLRDLQELCDAWGCIFVVDEVYCGFGRLGTMFGYADEDFRPDMITMSKGMTSGVVPMGAVVADCRIRDAFMADPLMSGIRYGHTTSGHVLGCAAALAVMDHVEPDPFLKSVQARGEQLLHALQDSCGDSSHGVVDIRGRGLSIALDMGHSGRAAEFISNVRSEGALLRQQNSAALVVPPLTITEEQTADLANRIILGHRKSVRR